MKWRKEVQADETSSKTVDLNLTIKLKDLNTWN